MPIVEHLSLAVCSTALDRDENDALLIWGNEQSESNPSHKLSEVLLYLSQSLLAFYNNTSFAPSTSHCAQFFSESRWLTSPWVLAYLLLFLLSSLCDNSSISVAASWSILFIFSVPLQAISQKLNTASEKRSLHLPPSHLFTALVGSTRLPPCQNLWTAGTLGSPVLQNHISGLGNFALQTLAQRLKPNERKLHLLAERNTLSVLGSRWFSSMNMLPIKPWMLKQKSPRKFGHPWKCSRFPPTINFISPTFKSLSMLASRMTTTSTSGPQVSGRTSSPRFVQLSLKSTTSAPMDGALLASLNRGIPKIRNSAHHDIPLSCWMKTQPLLRWNGILRSMFF